MTASLATCPVRRLQERLLIQFLPVAGLVGRKTKFYGRCTARPVQCLFCARAAAAAAAKESSACRRASKGPPFPCGSVGPSESMLDGTPGTLGWLHYTAHSTLDFLPFTPVPVLLTFLDVESVECDYWRCRSVRSACHWGGHLKPLQRNSQAQACSTASCPSTATFSVQLLGSSEVEVYWDVSFCMWPILGDIKFDAKKKGQSFWWISLKKSVHWFGLVSYHFPRLWYGVTSSKSGSHAMVG